VDFSRLKLEVYDLLGLVLPGFIIVAEGWILFRGWHAFLISLNQISGTGLTLLLLVSFGAGNVVQELGDFTVKLIKGNRYLRRGRDRFWDSADAQLVKNAIAAELGHPIPSPDAAFDYCLTKVGDRFVKRDLFVATSDLCRSLVVLSALAVVPAVRVISYDLNSFVKSSVSAVLLAGVLITVVLLMWRRMVRFRELSDITLFAVYLATTKDPARPLAERPT
jgi:hypothetical protein